MSNWTKKEESKARRLMQRAPAHRDAQLVVYWFVVLVMVVLSLLISMYLVPFFMVLSSPYIFLIVGLLGLSFGAMFNNLAIHLEHVDNTHYFIAGLIVPIVSLASYFLMVHIATYMAALLDLSVRQNPLEVGLVYVIGFLLPYLYGLLYQRNTFK